VEKKDCLVFYKIGSGVENDGWKVLFTDPQTETEARKLVTKQSSGGYAFRVMRLVATAVITTPPKPDNIVTWTEGVGE